MRTRYSCLAALFLLFAIGCGKKGIEEKKIGAVLPLTGSIAQYGKYMQQGLELALDDAINKGLIKPNEIKLVVEDGEANPAKSVDAFMKLVNVDKIIGVIPATSGVILAIKPIANEKKVVLLNASAISTQIEDSSDYCFSVLPNASVEGKFLAEFSYNTLSKRNAGVLYRNDPSGKSFHENFVQKFRELGGTIVYEEAHQPELNDFRSHISQIHSIKFLDLLFVASFGPEVATYVRQATELGLKTQVITYETFNSPKVLEIAGTSANGVLFCANNFDPNSNDPIINELKEKVLKKFNQSEVNYYIASHYDAMMLLITAIANNNQTGESIRNYLKSLRVYNGMTGQIQFDKNGGATIPLSIYTVRNNKFVRY